MCFHLKNKKIDHVKIIAETEGISDDEKMLNYTVGHMMGGFDGMVHADILNDELSATTTFKIFYTNGDQEVKVVRNSSLAYAKYIKYLKG